MSEEREFRFIEHPVEMLKMSLRQATAEELYVGLCETIDFITGDHEGLTTSQVLECIFRAVVVGECLHPQTDTVYDLGEGDEDLTMPAESIDSFLRFLQESPTAPEVTYDVVPDEEV